MENKEIAFRKMEEIKKEFGIEVIKEFIEKERREARKKQKKTNSYVDIAIRVYRLMINDNYGKTRAMEEVERQEESAKGDAGVKFNTIRNHCFKFDKEAKEFDFYSFGAFINDIRGAMLENNYSLSQTIQEVANLNNTTYEIAKIYYFKYKNERQQHEVNLDKFNMPSIIDDRIPF